MTIKELLHDRHNIHHFYGSRGAVEQFFSALCEFYFPFHDAVDRIVRSRADIFTGYIFISALANDNVTGVGELAV